MLLTRKHWPAKADLFSPPGRVRISLNWNERVVQKSFTAYDGDSAFTGDDSHVTAGAAQLPDVEQG